METDSNSYNYLHSYSQHSTHSYTFTLQGVHYLSGQRKWKMVYSLNNKDKFPFASSFPGGIKDSVVKRILIPFLPLRYNSLLASIVG